MQTWQTEGTDDVVRCFVKQLPFQPTEYAAVWIASTREPSTHVRISFSVSGDVSDFGQLEKATIAEVIADEAGDEIQPSQIAVTFQSASVLVTVEIDLPISVADGVAESLAGGIFASKATLQDAFERRGATSIRVIDILASPAVVGSTMQDLSGGPDLVFLGRLENNPIAITVLLLLVLDLLSLRLAWLIASRGASHIGLIGLRKLELATSKGQVNSSLTNLHAAGAESTKDRLALNVSSSNSVPSAASISAQFRIHANHRAFDDAAMLRRLATLLGVEESAVGATWSLGESAGVLVVDTEIECADAASLVSAAKMLKKAREPLSLALGVQIAATPRVEVGNPSAQRAGDDHSLNSSGSRSIGSAPQPTRLQSMSAEQMIPTIQERIPAAGCGLKSVGCGMSSGRPGVSIGRIQQPALSVANGQNATNIFTTKASTPSGIQERIPFTGMGGGSTRGRGALRSRTACSSQNKTALDGDEGQHGLASQLGVNVLERLRLTVPNQASTGCSPSALSTPAFSTRDGIQERLPAMPGLRRPREGMPRITRAPRTNQMTGVVQTKLNESVARPPSPPSSPPSLTTANPSSAVPGARNYSRTSPPIPGVPRTRFATTIRERKWQSSSKVMPSSSKSNALAVSTVTAQSNTSDPEPLDCDKGSPYWVVWDFVRQHTLVNACATVLGGEALGQLSVAQALQLLWCTLIWLLFLSTAQFRYAWYGATWATGGASDGTIARLGTVSAVAVAAAIVCSAGLLVARWLLISVRRVAELLPPRQARFIAGYVWSLLLLCCFAMAVSAISMSINMGAQTIRHDVMHAWVLATVVQWFALEPLCLFLMIIWSRTLRWCSTFDDL